MVISVFADKRCMPLDTPVSGTDRRTSYASKLEKLHQDPDAAKMLACVKAATKTIRVRNPDFNPLKTTSVHMGEYTAITYLDPDALIRAIVDADF